jgi:hypothetical protein
MITATLKKMPCARNTGQVVKNREIYSRRTLSQLAGPGQAQSFNAEVEAAERQRTLERQKVFAVQLSRARRQILAYRLWDSIDRWREIPAEVGFDE